MAQSNIEDEELDSASVRLPVSRGLKIEDLADSAGQETSQLFSADALSHAISGSIGGNIAMLGYLHVLRVSWVLTAFTQHSTHLTNLSFERRLPGKARRTRSSRAPGGCTPTTCVSLRPPLGIGKGLRNLSLLC